MNIGGDCLALLVTSLLSLSACGADAVPPDAVMLDNPELAMHESGYMRAPEGCPLLPESIRPVLPMPWSHIVQTFIPPGEVFPEFDVDYEVAPLAPVESLTATFHLDPRTQPASSTSNTHCPGRVSPSFWAPDAISNDVIRCRIAALDGEAHGRYADVFASRGTRTISIPLSGLDLSSTDPQDHWFVAFEPAVGDARLALAAIPSNPGASFEMTGLPDGAGRIVVLQTASVIKQPNTIVLHAPNGFAADFSAFSRGWYQAMVWPQDPSPSQLSAVVPSNVTARYARLGDPNLEWRASESPLVVGISGRTTSGVIAMECNSAARLSVTGFATVALSVNGGSTTYLEPGDVATPSTACPSGAASASWSLSTTSLNGRRSDVVVGGVP